MEKGRLVAVLKLFHATRLAKTLALLAGIVCGFNSSGYAADPKQDSAIECLVIGNHVGRNVSPDHSGRNNIKAKQRFSNWMFDANVLKKNRRILLFWQANVNGRSSLRIAIDNEQSKNANLLSITDDTVVASFFNSDRMTTRSWMFTINFTQERVMTSGVASNFSGMRSQTPTLACIFHTPGDPAFKSTILEDDWRNCCVTE